MSDRTDSAKRHTLLRWIGLIAGPLLAALTYYLLPHQYLDASGGMIDFTSAGRATLAVMVWMATWWLTEAVEITVTALLPLVLFPLLGVTSLSKAAAPYANPLIFLFMGGFLLAISMQEWGLGRRIALMTLRLVGTKPTRMIGGFMFVTALLSAFVSNTATAAMMLPIALSVIALLGRHQSIDKTSQSTFAICLLLGIAYAASIGGVATIIGTPPNVFLVGFLRDSIDSAYRYEVSFVRWLGFGLPFSAIFLPMAWILLTRVLYPIKIKEIPGGADLIKSQLSSLGRPVWGEWVTFIVFCLAVFFWIFSPWLSKWELALSGGTVRPFAHLSDPMIAIGAALLLFVIPSRSEKQRFVLVWDNTKDLPWGVLLLFGGGLSLADAVAANGVAEFFGAQATAFAGLPPILLVAVVAALVIFLTELTSNTATTATLVPVLAGMAPGLGVHPYLLIFPAAIAASCAFMLPVATPPNAIVFGSGAIQLPQMARAGFWLNILGVLLITPLVWIFVGTMTK